MNKKNLPDFLIVGAAKCGTTSLYNYLSQHKDIFLPDNKEPKYFVSNIIDFPLGGKGDDLTEELMVKDFEEYKRLFKPKTESQISGEASVDYFFYAKEMAPLIKEKLGDVKILIMLRNPITRAFSAYNHMIRDVRETESFEKALILEENRKSKNYEFVWYYKSAGLYYENLKIFKRTFSNIKVILFDDFKSNTRNTVAEVCEFLGVDTDFNPDISKTYNSTGYPKSKLLQKILKGSPNQLTRQFFKTIFAKKQRLFIRHYLESLNLKKERKILSNDTYDQLLKYYEEDLKMLKKDFKIELIK
jgi:hypothetical protein